jgi:YesN/AraC family two-component response regulator
MSRDKVLFVDDETSILSSIKRAFISENFECLFASTGEEAIKIMDEEEICVIVSDMRMPGMDGLKLLKYCKENHPLTMRIVLSGYVQLQQLLTTINQADIFKFITKPWRGEDEFKEVIIQAIEFYNMQKEYRNKFQSMEKKNEVFQNLYKTILDKYSNIIKDLDIMKKIVLLGFDDLETQMNEELHHKTEKFRVLINQYLDLSPTTIEEFTTQTLYDHVKEYIEKNSFEYNVSLIPCDNIHSFKDNLKTILFIIDHIFYFKYVIAIDIEFKCDENVVYILFKLRFENDRVNEAFENIHYNLDMLSKIFDNKIAKSNVRLDNNIILGGAKLTLTN